MNIKHTMKMKQKCSNQIVGNIGMYYVCYRLSLLGWNVMPTARNAKGIDIVAYPANGDDYIGIQVKTLSRRNQIPIGTKPIVENEKVLWCIVVKQKEGGDRTYVLKPSQLNRMTKLYTGKLYLQFKEIEKSAKILEALDEEGWSRLVEEIVNK